MGNQQESIFLEYPRDTKYFIDSDGNVFSRKRGKAKALTPHFHQGKGYKKYLRMRIGGKLELVHRIVASAKIGRTLTCEEQVNHLNGDTLDNRIGNLEVVTFAENVEHAVKNGLYCSGDDWYSARR